MPPLPFIRFGWGRLFSLVTAVAFGTAVFRLETFGGWVTFYFAFWAGFWAIRTLEGCTPWRRFPAGLRPAVRLVAVLCAGHILLAWLMPFKQDTAVGMAYLNSILGLRLAIATGSDPDRVGWDDHDTPLTCAARYGNYAMVVFLVEEVKVDINRRNDFRQTAFQTTHDATVAAYLRSKGAAE
jgi:hypothetical protein